MSSPLHPPPPPREQLCNRYCSNNHTLSAAIMMSISTQRTHFYFVPYKVALKSPQMSFQLESLPIKHAAPPQDAGVTAC